MARASAMIGTFPGFKAAPVPTVADAVASGDLAHSVVTARPHGMSLAAKPLREPHPVHQGRDVHGRIMPGAKIPGAAPPFKSRPEQKPFGRDGSPGRMAATKPAKAASSPAPRPVAARTAPQRPVAAQPPRVALNLPPPRSAMPY